MSTLQKSLVFLLLLTGLLFGPFTTAFGAAKESEDDVQAGSAAGKLNKYIQVMGIWRKQGLIVVAVKQEGPAAKQKIMPGDVVVEVEGKKIGSREEYIAAMNNARDAGSITMKVRKRVTGKTEEVKVGSAPTPFANWVPGNEYVGAWKERGGAWVMIFDKPDKNGEGAYVYLEPDGKDGTTGTYGKWKAYTAQKDGEKIGAKKGDRLIAVDFTTLEDKKKHNRTMRVDKADNKELTLTGLEEDGNATGGTFTQLKAKR